MMKMKTLGLIGGTGWVSSLEYYKLINEGVNKALGGLEAARLILYSINYADIDRLNQLKDLTGVYEIVRNAAEQLTRCNIDGLMLCANTTHVFADKIIEEFQLPLVHIGEATALKVQENGCQKVAVLGTKFTMEMDFYRSKLADRGIEMIIPEKEDRRFIHLAINKELLLNQFLPETKTRFLRIIRELISNGVQGIVLGCTEIPLLIHQEDVDVPVFDTLKIHAEAGVEFMISS
jgi:aspartate racemase